jgi:Fanconi anemia group M protein
MENGERLNMPIYVDSRGSGEQEVYTLLKAKHLDVKRQYIESGDIVFGDESNGYVGIERKTISDLVNSVTGKNRHFWEQIKVLKETYKYPLVIVEGALDYKDKLISGILFSLTFGWRIQWISTYNTYDTAEAITRMFTRYGTNKASGYPPACVKKAMSPDKIKWAMLQCVRNVGPTTATNILKVVEFKALVNGEVDYEKLAKSVKGLGVSTSKRLVEAFQ